MIEEAAGTMGNVSFRRSRSADNGPIRTPARRGSLTRRRDAPVLAEGRNLSERGRLLRTIKIFSRRSGLRNQMLGTDLTKRVPALGLPAYFVHGRHDYTVPTSCPWLMRGSSLLL